MLEKTDPAGWEKKSKREKRFLFYLDETG